MVATAQPVGSEEYPVRYDVVRPEKQSRLTNFPLGIGLLIRYVLLIPHLIILAFLGLIAGLLYFIATFAILFSGRYPAGLYQFVLSYLRWSANVNAYALSLVDRYPPFSGDQTDYPLTFVAGYPEKSSRLLNFPLIGFYIRYLILIPHLVIVAFLGLAAFVVLFIAKFAILFTGSYPQGMYKFALGATRWGVRVQAYLFGLTDRYPPFSTN